MEWKSFKKELPELTGKILIRETLRRDHLFNRSSEVDYLYDLLSAEPMDIYSKFVWVKQTSNGSGLRAQLCDLFTNEYLASENKNVHWMRLPLEGK